jgi:hypothetical protein
MFIAVGTRGRENSSDIEHKVPEQLTVRERFIAVPVHGH